MKFMIFSKKYRWWLLGIFLLLLILIGWRLHSHKSTPLLPLVKVTAAKLQTVSHSYQTLGLVESPQSVTLMSQVTGTLSKINILPGANVKTDQLLFKIDANTAAAVLEQAQATLARDKAQLNYLNADAKRYASLVQLEYVTRDQYEQSQAAAAAQAALVVADAAQIKQAQIDIDHSFITAPIDGKIGSFNVRMGDLIVANTTVLATINQLNPIWIDFSIPQKLLTTIQNAKQPLTVEILAEDGKTKLTEATVFFIDNNVNNATGTIALKAKTANENYSLWPGENVRIHLILGETKNALVIPLQAIQFDEEGSFVYVLKDNIAVIQRVTVIQQTRQIAVISTGLKPNDLVLTTLPPNMENGLKVKAVNLPGNPS